MRIAIDARWIFRELSGVGTYTRELVRHLGRIDTTNHYTLFFQHEDLCQQFWPQMELEGLTNFEPCFVSSGVFSPRSQLQLPFLLKRLGIDVYHSPNYMIPLLAFPRRQGGRPRCVCTIHDVIPLVFPDHAPRSRKSRVYPLYRWLMKEIGRRSDSIITVSEASRRDILTHLGIPREREKAVHRVYNGVASGFATPTPRPTRGPSEARQLLYVGRFDPYKNVSTLVEAFAEARTRTPFPLHLRIVGAPDPRYPEVETLVRARGLADDVTWTGYLSDDALRATYQASDLMVHPSRYEGFGLQILEAMAASVPVLCSNAASLPEVGGDAAAYFDPNETAALADLIVSVITDEARLAAMAVRGLEQTRRFTWDDCATQTLAIYRDLLHDGH